MATRIEKMYAEMAYKHNVVDVIAKRAFFSLGRVTLKLIADMLRSYLDFTSIACIAFPTSPGKQFALWRYAFSHGMNLELSIDRTAVSVKAAFEPFEMRDKTLTLEELGRRRCLIYLQHYITDNFTSSIEFGTSMRSETIEYNIVLSLPNSYFEGAMTINPGGQAGEGGTFLYIKEARYHAYLNFRDIVTIERAEFSNKQSGKGACYFRSDSWGRYKERSLEFDNHGPQFVELGEKPYDVDAFALT